MESPLAKYKRQPKLYISLPHGGKWYSKNNIAKTEDIEVYSMTANDEIALKVPDGLYSGKVVTEVIRNCIPSIKDPWMIPMTDFDYLLASVRLASYGDTINIESKCRECQNIDTFGVEIQNILRHYESIEFESDVKINDFLFRMRPLYYKEASELSKVSMQVQRTLVQTIPKIEDETERQENIDALYAQINQATLNAVSATVVDISTPDGEVESQPQIVQDFIKNGDPVFFNSLQEAYKKNTEKFTLPKSNVECSECGHKTQIAPNLDYANFFGVG
jgi:hypothetical protein